jgi:hypothetical protein
VVAGLKRIVDVATHAAQTQDKAWHIDEIEIGLTLSAKANCCSSPKLAQMRA